MFALIDRLSILILAVRQHVPAIHLSIKTVSLMSNLGSPFTIFDIEHEEFVPRTPVPDPMNVTKDHLSEIDLTQERHTFYLAHIPSYEEIRSIMNA